MSIASVHFNFSQDQVSSAMPAQAERRCLLSRLEDRRLELVSTRDRLRVEMGIADGRQALVEETISDLEALVIEARGTMPEESLRTLRCCLETSWRLCEGSRSIAAPALERHVTPSADAVAPRDPRRPR